jgi:hypothetical protein
VNFYDDYRRALLRHRNHTVPNRYPFIVPVHRCEWKRRPGSQSSAQHCQASPSVNAVYSATRRKAINMNFDCHIGGSVMGEANAFFGHIARRLAASIEQFQRKLPNPSRLSR